jgi:predicted ester cyclase
MGSSTQRNEETLRRFLDEVWNRGKVEACADFLAPAYTIRHDPGDPWDGQTLDLRGFQERLTQSRQPFPDQRFEIQEIVGEGDVLACAWLWTGTHLGPVGPFLPTGKTVTLSGITLYDFEEGRIRGHWQVVDRLSLLQQLSPPSSPAG